MALTTGTWSFNPIVTAFPPTVLPNIQYYNVTNGTWTYQVHISYPLNWTSTNADSTVDTLYVLDGNALAHTATEAFRKRRSVDFNQPDTIVVSIGYPDLIPDSPYSNGRYYDYQMPVCANCSAPTEPVGIPSGGEAFITFIDTVLRPWIHSHFPNVNFNRDGLYGHSFAGLFVVYAMFVRPDLFDVFLSASPYLIWNNQYFFSPPSPLYTAPPPPANTTKPAFQLSFGGYEQHAQKRRTETEAEYEYRRDFLASLQTETLVLKLYNQIKNSTRFRDVELHEYPFSYHAAVGGNALADGIDYFLDW
ncbi:Alpha/Beta hydrolase protein [Lophiotrema nucula]|uniref:Alpha/Beta hydrolase protein n=1 Tax=Lophiotrema nucula TaxID=690887 RepID=A0A6A5ZC03_9PLEO|nr:Alpha/Beta hydrolase protein [Lophiotrema nucula]